MRVAVGDKPFAQAPGIGRCPAAWRTPRLRRGRLGRHGTPRAPQVPVPPGRGRRLGRPGGVACRREGSCRPGRRSAGRLALRGPPTSAGWARPRATRGTPGLRPPGLGVHRASRRTPTTPARTAAPPSDIGYPTPHTAPQRNPDRHPRRCCGNGNTAVRTTQAAEAAVPDRAVDTRSDPPRHHRRRHTTATSWPQGGGLQGRGLQADRLRVDRERQSHSSVRIDHSAYSLRSTDHPSTSTHHSATSSPQLWTSLGNQLTHSRSGAAGPVAAAESRADGRRHKANWGWCHAARRTPARGPRPRTGRENRQPRRGPCGVELARPPHRTRRDGQDRQHAKTEARLVFAALTFGVLLVAIAGGLVLGLGLGLTRAGATPVPSASPGPATPVAASPAPYPLSPASPAPPIVPRGDSASTTRSASRTPGSSTSTRSSTSPRHAPSQPAQRTRSTSDGYHRNLAGRAGAPRRGHRPPGPAGDRCVARAAAGLASLGESPSPSIRSCAAHASVVGALALLSLVSLVFAALDLATRGTGGDAGLRALVTAAALTHTLQRAAGPRRTSPRRECGQVAPDRLPGPSGH